MTTTLGELREYIEALASDDGEFYVVCGRYGDRPVPAAGLRFDSRATARAGLRAVRRYRQRLREYDAALPEYDLIVCQDTDHEDCPTTAWTMSDPVVTGQSETAGLVEFCHRIAGAVFEALSTSGHEDIEQAILDCYTEHAAERSDRDELSLCILESAADELAARLSPAKQAAVLARAAARIETSTVADQPVATACADLRTHGMVEDVARSPWTVSAADGQRQIVIELSGYALSERDQRLPILPVVVACFTRGLDRAPTTTRVEALDDGWELTFVFGDDGVSDGLASTPIRT